MNKVEFNPKNFSEWAKDKTVVGVAWGLIWRLWVIQLLIALGLYFIGLIFSL